MERLFRYISRENCLRLGLFLVLLAAAGLFDKYHEPFVSVQKEATQEKPAVEGSHFFCTLQSQVILRVPVEKTTPFRVNSEKWNRFLVARVKARLTCLRKEEERKQPQILPEVRRLIAHRFSHFVNPDDLPHTS